MTSDKDGNEDKDTTRDKEKDRLIEDYDSILRESALLTTVAGILFGFLLNISVSPPEGISDMSKIILLVSLFSIVISTLLFSMPVVYHHIQYPYRKFEKFQTRYHRFIIFGIIPFFLTLYLSLSVAIFIFIDLPASTNILVEYLISFVLAAIPFGIILILYKLRK